MSLVHNPEATSRSRWFNNSEFASITLAGDLIGVTGENQGVFVQDATRELWQRAEGDQWSRTSAYLLTRAVPESDAHPEFDTVLCPPPGESPEEATVTLDGGDDELAAYILERRDTHGPWKYLTKAAWETLARSAYELPPRCTPTI